MAKIRAVTGDISPAELGITLMHDHLLVDNNPWRTIMHPKDERKRLLAEAPVSLQMRGEISRDANLCADNNILHQARPGSHEHRQDFGALRMAISDTPFIRRHDLLHDLLQ